MTKIKNMIVQNAVIFLLKIKHLQDKEIHAFKYPRMFPPQQNQNLKQEFKPKRLIQLTLVHNQKILNLMVLNVVKDLKLLIKLI